MNTVEFDERDSFKDFGFFLGNKTIALPELQTNIIEVPGMDGQLDLSTVLTGGKMKYKNRQIQLEFWTKQDNNADKFINYLHGRRRKFIFSDDPDWYYEGTCACGENKYEKGYNVIPVNINADPYKLAVHETHIKDRITASKDLRLFNDNMWTIPLITSDRTAQVKFQGKTYLIYKGCQENEDIILREGVNILRILTPALIEIQYRQGRI